MGSAGSAAQSMRHNSLVIMPTLNSGASNALEKAHIVIHCDAVQELAKGSMT